MNDLISRQAAIDKLKREEKIFYSPTGLRYLIGAIRDLPSAQPTEASCWGCNCPKMERLNEQKTFSEMVHLHDAETHSCDLISRQAALNLAKDICVQTEDGSIYRHRCIDPDEVRELPSAQPERKNGEWIHKPDIYLDEQTWECSECGEPWIFIEGTPSENNANFCPNCGADMRGEQNG